MKRLLTALTATTIGVLAVSGGASADDDGGAYPPAPSDMGPSAPIGVASGTEADPGGTLPATGSGTSGPLQSGGVLLVSGLGLLGAAKLRRQRASV